LSCAVRIQNDLQLDDALSKFLSNLLQHMPSEHRQNYIMRSGVGHPSSHESVRDLYAGIVSSPHVIFGFKFLGC
jgi:hypothetical protein